MNLPVFSSSDLRAKLEQVRGKPIPLSTLKSWRKKLGISCDANKLYSQEDLDNLKGMIYHMQSGGTIEQYRRLKLLEQRKYAD